MPWSGSAPNQTFVRSTGTQSGATAWQLEDAAGTRVVAAKFDTHDQDIADGLSATLKRDGGNKPTANLPMGNFKLTGMGVGSASTDSLTLAQAQADIIAHASAVGGTADAITATFSPAFAAWTDKMRFRFTAGGANTVTNPTVNVDGLGAKTIKKLNSAALAVGEIVGAGHICDCVYNGTDVILLNANYVPPASTTVPGIVELATSAETQARTDAARAVTPAGLAAATRELLLANRTYYVRTNGNDSNNGLADTAGGAFLTIQKGVDTAAGLDFNGFTVTVQVAAGTYTATLIIPPSLKDADKLIIQGDTGTPGNVIISVTGGDCITASDGAAATVQGFEFRTTTSGNCLVATRGALIKYGSVNFGAAANRHISSSLGALIKAIGNYTINGNASNHFIFFSAGKIDASGLTITLSGSRAFTIWAVGQSNGYCSVLNTSYVGSATGTRHNVSTGAGFDTGGVTQPGGSAGSTTSPGWAT